MADLISESEVLPQPEAAGSIHGRILLIDGDELVRDSVARVLIRGGHEVSATSDGKIALGRLGAERFDLILADLKIPRTPGGELFSAAGQLCPDLPVVLMTACTSVRTAVEAVRRGACDYIQKPFDPDDLLRLVARTLEHARLKQENLLLREAVGAQSAPRPLIGDGQALREVRSGVERVAPTSTSILICGERGTGKETVARIIHARSPRTGRPLLAINCAALSESMLERELFGCEKGAFAGVDRTRRGRLDLTEGGTLLLKEVSRTTPALQARLLRVIEKGMFERVGSSVPQRADVRVIATTTDRRLEMAVARGEFREDLFYRLDRAQLEVPPLRERREDIPALVLHFLHGIARREGQPSWEIEPAALRLLQKFDWPGNVRELKNIVERATVLERSPGVVRAATVGPWLVTEDRSNGGGDPLDNLPLAEVEKRVILETLAKFEGHRTRTAGALGIGVRTLGIKLKKWRESGDLVEAPYL